LVYFDGERYHIADYKSNYLGADQHHYQATQIAESMSLSSYWLQAALYLVALHRYLAVKLQNYDIQQHLGGASYLYLRGMNAEPNQGYFYWKPEDEFILRLDAILGYFSEDKLSEIM
jgi:exodeoxyribonuclease V beta subunit